MSSGYEDEMETTPPRKIKNNISKKSSEEELIVDNESQQAPKKLSVKTMVHEALIDLKSRKGTSLYAIKKYLQMHFDVDVAKVNYIIKKLIKNEVEAGIIVQLNGVGATGSFKLAPTADKAKKKPKSKKVEKKNTKETEGKTEKIKTSKSDTKTEKTITKGTNIEKVSVKRKLDLIEENDKEKMVKSKARKQSKMKKIQTPLKKKAALSKRKSIGSIIRPPKMKPKA